MREMAALDELCDLIRKGEPEMFRTIYELIPTMKDCSTSSAFKAMQDIFAGSGNWLLWEKANWDAEIFNDNARLPIGIYHYDDNFFDPRTARFIHSDNGFTTWKFELEREVKPCCLLNSERSKVVEALKTETIFFIAYTDIKDEKIIGWELEVQSEDGI